MDLHFATSQFGDSRNRDDKRCTACGGTIQWRRRLAKHWREVMYCSASCRRASVVHARTDINQRAEAYDHIFVDSVSTAA